MRHKRYLLFVLGAVGTSLGCGSTGGGAEIDAGIPSDASLASPKANVRFKGNDRLRADIAQALALGSGKVCNELGKYSCTHRVHRVPLLGAAAYDLGLYRPLPETTMTAPIAADRVALSACTQRVDRDLADAGSAVVWKELSIQSGNLSNVEAAPVTDAITSIYRRALQRDPSADELIHHRDLYREVERIGSTRAARDWAVLSCFTVITSVEFLFY